MNSDQSLLAQVPIFSSLSLHELERLASEMRAIDVPANTVLFTEGESGEHFYVVREGQVDIIKGMGSSDERLIATRGPGEFVGEMSLFNRDGLRTASVRTRVPTRLWEMNRAEFNALLRREPDLVYEMVRILSMRLTTAHNAAIQELQEKNRQLQDAYDELKAAQAQIIEKEKLEKELQVAHEIQMSILPETYPRIDGFELGALLVPARSVGGDWFDFIPLEGNRLGVVVGDVTDKGVPAAIFMAQVHALLRAEAQRGQGACETLEKVHRLLLDMNSAGMFATVVYGILDCASGEFVFARAGHELPMVCTANGVVSEAVLGPATPLGGIPFSLIDEQTLMLAPGETLLLFTDGVTESYNPDHELFERERLRETLRSRATLSAQKLCDEILHAVTVFQGTADQHDDITLVAVQRLT